MLASELLNVAVKVLRAHLVEGSLVGALERGPEGLYAVRMGHAVTYSPALCLTASWVNGSP